METFGLSLLLFTELFCARTAVISYDKTWDDFDKKTLYRAAHVCYTKYYPNSPCVKAFTKKPKRDYIVICGREE